MDLQHTLVIQFSYTYSMLKMNLAGIDHEASLVSPEPGGNCLNWVVRHVVSARDRMLQDVLGLPGIFSTEAHQVYGLGTEALTDAAKALPLDVLLRIFEASQEPLRQGLKQVSEELLSEPAPFS